MLIEDIVSAKAEELGVLVLIGMSAIGFEERESHALLKIQTTKDQHAFTKTIVASYVVGADGSNSFLRHAIGSKRLDLGFDPVDAPYCRLSAHQTRPRYPEVDGSLLDPESKTAWTYRPLVCQFGLSLRVFTFTS